MKFSGNADNEAQSQRHGGKNDAVFLTLSFTLGFIFILLYSDGCACARVCV